MTRRLLALALTAACALPVVSTSTASACQPDTCPQTPTCQYIRATCIRPF